MTVGVWEDSCCTLDHYNIYAVDGDQGLIRFEISKTVWTSQELHDMAETMKAFAMDADKDLLERIDR
jgi:hypothetical protein